MKKLIQKRTAAVIAAAVTSLAQLTTILPGNVLAGDNALSVSLTGLASAADSKSAVTLCGAWYEEAYAEWDSNAIGSGVTVSYSEAGSNELVQVDSELIRGTRVDIPGLKGNTEYTIHIEGSAGKAECTVKTMTFDRSGYAHYNYSGIGAYNDDGTLKPDVTVIYVTNENKDTITYNGKTGLYNIFFSANSFNRS